MIQERLISGYVIDTSALIDLWRVCYPPDVFQTLWKKNLEEIIRMGLLISPKEVYRELQQRDDELFNWAKDHKMMFIALDEEQTNQVKIIMSKFRKLTNDEKTTPDADPFVVSLAMSRAWIVITSERSNPGGKPRIPDVCTHYSVKCIKLLQFLRERGWKY